MLNENIKRARKAKGLSQEELAVKLNVVRQTVSKWENGLSVPDSDLLIFLAEELDTSVSALLGETIQEQEPDDLKTISEKLEIINLQLAKRAMARTKVIRWGLLRFTSRKRNPVRRLILLCSFAAPGSQAQKQDEKNTQNSCFHCVTSFSHPS